jgi:23S rRNA (uracil1939-C5)-methyltransferase
MPEPHLDLTIASVIAGGDGLAREDDGRVVFVAGALPGEQVRAAVTEEKRGYARAALLEVISASPARIAPPCPHVADGCGGCSWQHVDPVAQRELKAGIVLDALRRTAKLEPPAIALGPDLDPFGHRTTVRVAVRDGRAGFRHLRSHDVVGVDACLVAHPLLDELIQHGHFGAAEEATLRAGVATGERLALLDPDADDGVELPADVLVVGQHGRGAVHEVVAGRRWRISAKSFFQVRPDGAEALVTAVRAAVGDDLKDGGRLVDLYSGVGLFAGTLGERARHVVAVEASAPAARDARHNLRNVRAEVIEGDVTRWRPVAADVVVADPSRAGLGRQAVERIARTGASVLALVSCDPAAFARDASLLAAAGYGLASVTLIDLFPHTPHVEIVSRFDRSSSAVARSTPPSLPAA